MDANWFSSPLRLNLGGKSQEIDSVTQALELLEAWPSARRGPVHKCALAVCRGAVDGTMSGDDARRSFESFARITGLIERSPAVSAMTAVGGLVKPLSQGPLVR